MKVQSQWSKMMSWLQSKCPRGITTNTNTTNLTVEGVGLPLHRLTRTLNMIFSKLISWCLGSWSEFGFKEEGTRINGSPSSSSWHHKMECSSNTPAMGRNSTETTTDRQSSSSPCLNLPHSICGSFQPRIKVTSPADLTWESSVLRSRYWLKKMSILKKSVFLLASKVWTNTPLIVLNLGVLRMKQIIFPKEITFSSISKTAKQWLGLTCKEERTRINGSPSLRSWPPPTGQTSSMFSMGKSLMETKTEILSGKSLSLAWRRST